MSDCSYFADVYAAQKRLRERGFEGHPGNVKDVLDYAMTTDEKLETLCRALNFTIETDHRGQWHARRTKKVI